MAQLEERGSHNPEVVSSILTSRISFPTILLFMESTRDLGTVVLTQSITKGDAVVGKIQPNGSAVESNGMTYEKWGVIRLH